MQHAPASLCLTLRKHTLSQRHSRTCVLSNMSRFYTMQLHVMQAYGGAQAVAAATPLNHAQRRRAALRGQQGTLVMAVMMLKCTASAAQGKQTSRRHAAANRPVVLLRGVNHAQLSNGALREGDLEPEQGAAGATAAAAAVLGDFVAAHMIPERCSPGQAALHFCCVCLQLLLTHC